MIAMRVRFNVESSESVQPALSEFPLVQSPVGGRDLRDAVEAMEIPAADAPRVFRPQDFIFLSDNTKCWLVRTGDISMLEACGNYTRVHMGDSVAMVRRPLRECERKLDQSLFFRARRDCLINLSLVRQTKTLTGDRFLFVLADGTEVPLSRNQSILFRRMKAL